MLHVLVSLILLKTLREGIPRRNEIQEFLKTLHRQEGNPEGFIKLNLINLICILFFTHPIFL